MPVNRSVRTLIAAGFLIAALFVAMDYAVEATPLVGWWLPLVLFVVGILAAGSTRLGGAEETVTAPAVPATYREYQFPALSPAAGVTPATAGPEEPGEINVREPVIDTQVERQTAVTPTVTLETASASGAAPADEIAPPAEHVPVTQPNHDPPTAASEPEPEAIGPNDEFGRIDATGQGVPTSVVKPDVPEVSSAERLTSEGVVLQPANTAENEFQSGEHVAHTLPTDDAPGVNQTTGEGFGPGHAPIAPEERVVLDTQAAPPQPQDQGAASANAPEVVDAVMSDRDSEAEAAALTSSGPVASTPASGEGPDNLTIIHGIGPKIAQSLQAAGIDSYTKLAGATDADLENAIKAGGVRLAPTLNTWREQAAFLARGDRDGFESLRRKLQQGGVESGD